MWYVIQVIEGSTDIAFQKCRQAFPATVYKEIFIPMYECMRKYKGEWHLIRRELFPRYFFVDTDFGEMVEESLRLLSRFVKPVCVGKGFVPITKAEQMTLESLMDASHVIRMSRGDLIDGEFEIYEGPLQGRGTVIRRIDRHKRIGDIEVSLLGERKRVQIGLEIVRKVNRDEIGA